MPRLSDEAKQYINSEFARRLEEGDPPYIDVIIEVERGRAEEIVPAITAIEGVTLGTAGIIDQQYIPATVPDPQIENIAKIEGVELVHQDQLTGVMRTPLKARDIPFLSAENDPIRSTLSAELYEAFSPQDPYVGQVGISDVEVPRFNFAQLPIGDPFETALAIADQYGGASMSGESIIPTTEAVDWIRDSGLTDGAVNPDSGVAVIDTGHTPTAPENGIRLPRLESWVPGEPPLDMMGHGCASPDTKVHTTLTGIDTMKSVWDALTERCETEPLDSGADQGDTIPNPVMGDGHSPLRVQTLNKETGGVEAKPVDEMYRIDVDEDIYKVTLSSGTTLELTPWHPTLVFRGGKVQKVRADELESGDAVLAPDSRGSFYGPGRTLTLDHDRGWHLTKEKAWAVGAFLGDGNARRSDDNSRYEVTLTNNDIDVHKQFAESLSDIGDTARLRAADGSGATALSGDGVSDPTVLGAPDGKRLVTTKYGEEVTDFIESVCGDGVFGGGKSASINVPEVVENSRESVIGAFLAGYFDADGHVKSEKPKVIFSTSSEGMSEGLVYLLSEMGIDARIGVVTDKRDADSTKAQNCPSYRVIVSGGPDLQRFVRLVSGGVVSEGKRKRLMERLYEADFDNYQVSDKQTVGDARIDPVVGIETEPYKGYFYDFHIEDNHNYVAGKDGFAFISNSWCTNMAVGNRSPGAWGATEGVAPGSKYAHFKALNTFPGFGRTSWILKSMSRSIEWGADVVSMSLGGAQQGPVDEDPFCRFIRDNCKENAGDDDGAIFVVAAGNSGPARWTIGSPGAAPKALTVGSWSLMDASPAIFSSRGPQGAWYAENPDVYEQHIEDYGAGELVKPDVVAPGGGRENESKTMDADELLFQSSTGWYDGLKDGLKDGRANMKGTSMATPAVAGLVKRLYDAGIVKTAAEVKKVARQRAPVGQYPDAAEGANEARNGKNIAVGFGPLRESLFTPQ